MCAFFRTYCPWNICLLDIFSWAGMLWTITHVVTMACKCLHFEMSSKSAVGAWCGSSHHDVTILCKGLHVQVHTSCPSSMKSESKNQGSKTMVIACVCGMDCNGQGYSSPFLRRILWRKTCAHWVCIHSCLNCSCNYGWQTCSWVEQDFSQWISTHTSSFES